MYLLLGISLKFAFLLIVNMLAAFISASIWRIIERPIAGVSANARAQIIFALRVGPVAMALVFVFAFLLPAYLIHEPENSGEVVSLKLAVLALFSSVGVSVALYRVYKSWRATRALARAWQLGAAEISINEINVPTFKIVHHFPVIAVIGIIKPKIYIAEQVLTSLDRNELTAAMAHEFGHLKSHDNLKRSILRTCRDLLIVPIGTDLDRAWAENAETAADEYVAHRGRATALDLASALVKLARIAPSQLWEAGAAGSRLFAENNADVTERVRRLLKFADSSEMPVLPSFSFGAWIWPVALSMLFIFYLTDQRLLLATHNAIEQFVWIIQ